jgi:hypothetical protein
MYPVLSGDFRINIKDKHCCKFDYYFTEKNFATDFALGLEAALRFPLWALSLKRISYRKIQYRIFRVKNPFTSLCDPGLTNRNAQIQPN